MHINCLPFIKKDDPLYVNKDNNDWICTLCSKNIFPFIHLDDDSDFYSALSDYWPKGNSLPFELLDDDNLLFSPFELNDDESHLPTSDLDPDLQFYRNHANSDLLLSCKYYHEESFNNLVKEFDKKCRVFSSIHTNIRSALKNHDNFTSYLECLEHKFPLIGYSESWLNEDNKDTIGISGYKAEHSCRKDRCGGGVSLFVKDDIESSRLDDLCLNNSNIESVFCEFDRDQFNLEKNVIVGVIYRPPNTDISVFNEIVSELLTKLKSLKKYVHIMGDVNINLINLEKHVATQDFVDTLLEFGIIPTISKPTRVTKNSATLIDNIFTNMVKTSSSVFTGVLYTDITDHFPVFYIDTSVSLSINDSIIRKRVYSDENVNKFNSRLSSTDWTSVLSANDAQEAYSNFNDIMSKMYNECFPIREFKLGYLTRKPWLSEGMKRQIKIKNRLYRRHLRSHDPVYHTIYKRFRNILNKKLLLAEKAHYDKLINENKQNLRKSWKILKEIINKKKGSARYSKFIVNNSITTDKHKIAEGFNNFYINVGPDLAKDIPIVNCSPVDLLKNRVLNNFLLKEVCLDELEKCIYSMKDSSAGWDNFTANMIKKSHLYFKQPLLHVINLSFSTGIFPSELKVARVIPLFKAGLSTLFSNYRPVSVLPAFSKIFERLLYSRLLDFINENNVLYQFQFGFRERHSPNLALMLLVDNISRALEDGDYVLGLFLDFSKAFDTVNHDILFTKLEFYGVRGVALNLFKSYLSGRQQFVEYNGVSSTKRDIVCGVPQGSILGPLLFLIYINDLAHASVKIFSILFADDSNLFLSGKDPNQLIRTMNEELIHIVKWLQVNKLSINLKKTHFMIFRRRKVKIVLKEKIVINNVKISQVEKTKFLGVIIDHNLTFINHMKYTKGKIAKAIGILYRGKKFFNDITMKTLYNVFVYPYLMYCVEVWGKNCDSYLEPVLKKQRHALRLITGVSKKTPTTPIREKYELLSLHEIYVYAVQLFMFKVYHKLVPSTFQSFFVKNRDIHDYPTSSSNKYHVPLAKSYYTAKIVRSTGVSTFNFFYDKVDFYVEFCSYKFSLKKYLVQNNVNNIFKELSNHF